MRKVFFLMNIFMSVCVLGLFAQDANQNVKKKKETRWKGFNIGVNGGVLINDSKMNIDPAGNYLLGVYAANNGPRKDSWNYDNVGFTAGGQIGYNYQVRYVVFGFEGDFNYSSLDTTHRFSRVITTEVGEPTFEDDVYQKILWFGTARARVGLGYKIVQFYATGGFAYGEVGSITTITYRSDYYIGGEKRTRVGWTVGGGLNFSLAKHFFTRLEYLFVDLNRFKFQDPNIPNVYPGYYFETRIKPKFHCMRIGFDYKI